MLLRYTGGGGPRLVFALPEMDRDNYCRKRKIYVEGERETTRLGKVFPDFATVSSP